MVKICRWDKHRFVRQQELLAGLPLENLPVISLVGAGGKTHTMRELVREWQARGRACCMMTSTHIQKPDGWQIWKRFPDAGERCRPSVFLFGEECGDGKLSLPLPDLLREILTGPLPVVIEADGSRQKPCKVPAAHEPVILPETTMVLAVLGLSALGRPIREAAHRPGDLAEFLRKNPEDVVTEEDFLRLFTHARGLRKGVLPGQTYVAVMNQADDDGLLEAAARIAGKLSEAGIRHVFALHFTDV